MSSTKPKKAAGKTGGRTYASVEDLMKGEGISAEVQQAHAQLVRDTCVTDGLSRLRRAAKLTQAEVAQRLIQRRDVRRRPVVEEVKSPDPEQRPVLSPQA